MIWEAVKIPVNEANAKGQARTTLWTQKVPQSTICNY